jgi:hypothetical protein
MGAPLCQYTCAGGDGFLENWGYMAESERCCKVMVEAANSVRLHPTSILDVQKVFWHLLNNMPSKGILEGPNPLGVHPTSMSYV